MKYSKSKLIFEKVRNSKRILIGCHREPDVDSIGSALAFYYILRQIGVAATIVCPSVIPDNARFLPGSRKVKKIDFLKFDFSKYDLFLSLDTSSWDKAIISEDLVKPDIYLIVIDHHETNVGFGEINLVDKKSHSTSEILYELFSDWGVQINRDVATCLLAGIVEDTGAFRHPLVSVETFDRTKELIKRGADKDEIITKIYRSIDISVLKLWGEILTSLKMDRKGKFVHSSISYQKVKKLNINKTGQSLAASMFGQIVKGTDFGIVMVERKKNLLSVSFRSRTGFDVSRIAVYLGGGGSRYSAGAAVKGLTFEKAVDRVLKAAYKYT
jgi:phosphoesterase RecJ-like protein